jgi:hypothetical protein
MYDERWMFHEPAYQAVAEITASGTNGIRGRLRDLPAPGALLDAAGQLYGYWVMRAADRDYVAFPMRIDAIRYFGPGPDAGDLRFSDDLVIGFTTEALVGPIKAFPPQFVLVGPSMEGRPEPVDFPWDWLDPDRPGVLVSLGTVNADAGARFYATVVEALGDQPWQVVLAAPLDQVGAVPDNVLVRDYVPQVALLDRVDAVVSHGGHNTVCESLARGRPLVLAPIRDDQPIIAQQVVDAGAGLRVKFGRVRPPSCGLPSTPCSPNPIFAITPSAFALPSPPRVVPRRPPTTWRS